MYYGNEYWVGQGIKKALRELKIQVIIKKVRDIFLRKLNIF